MSRKITAALAALALSLTATPAYAAPGDDPTEVRYVTGDTSLFNLDYLADDWSTRTGVQVIVVPECSGTNCIRVLSVDRLPGDGDIVINGPAGQMTWAEDGTCLAHVRSIYSGDLRGLHVAMHEVGHCLWFLAPTPPPFIHADDPKALMHADYSGEYFRSERAAGLTSTDRRITQDAYENQP